MGNGVISQPSQTALVDSFHSWYTGQEPCNLSSSECKVYNNKPIPKDEKELISWIMDNLSKYNLKIVSDVNGLVRSSSLTSHMSPDNKALESDITAKSMSPGKKKDAIRDIPLSPNKIRETKIEMPKSPKNISTSQDIGSPNEKENAKSTLDIAPLLTNQDHSEEFKTNQIPEVDGISSREEFMDSVCIRKWLDDSEASVLFAELQAIGEKSRPQDLNKASKKNTRYPLWSSYYGCPRERDGALALDRWGSNCESWLRTEPTPPLIRAVADKLSLEFNLPIGSFNSILVNYYYDGQSTYIPAHRDTVACLKENSPVICLSLGATRTFLLCSNSDAGKYEKEEMTVEKEWLVENGDIFSLGPKTNESYCHAVPKEVEVDSMRISIIFRCVTKSFIIHRNDQNKIEEKKVTYANGTTKTFSSECVVCENVNDLGIREHIADLISIREYKKREKALKQNITQQQNIMVKKDEISSELRPSESVASEMGEKPSHRLAKSLIRRITSNIVTDIAELDNKAVKASELNDYYLGSGDEVPKELLMMAQDDINETGRDSYT